MPAPKLPVIQEYTFRVYGEFVCFWPLVVVGYVLALADNRGWMTPETSTWIWLITAMFSLIAVGVDLNWWQTAVLVGACVLVWALALIWGNVFLLSTIVAWLDRHDAVMSGGAKAILAHFVAVWMLGIWIRYWFTFWQISHNQLEHVTWGTRDFAEDLAGLSLRKVYPNFVKSILLGMGGDVHLLRGERTIYKIEDIPFLAFRWKILEGMKEARAVRVVSE